MPELDPNTRAELARDFPASDIEEVLRGVKASIDRGDTPDTPEALCHYVVSCLSHSLFSPRPCTGIGGSSGIRRSRCSSSQANRNQLSRFLGNSFF